MKLIDYFDYRQSLSIQKRFLCLFVHALALTTIAVIAAFFLFPSEVGTVSTFLVSFSLLTIFDFVLAKNRDDIWGQRQSPREANIELTFYLLSVFLGVFLVFLIIAVAFPRDLISQLFHKQLEGTATTLTAADALTFAAIFKHNIVVLVVFFFFSLFYRTGTVFVLAWNASVWGVVFGTAAHNQAQGAWFFYLTAPHLIAEALAFILASLSGLFLSKAVTKYKFVSKEFNQVLEAAAGILTAAIVVLVLAAFVETRLLALLTR